MTGEFDVTGPGHEGQGGGDWEIGEVLSTWYRPAFESYMVSAFDGDSRCLEVKWEVLC